MRVLVDYNDGTEPEELEVTDGSVHFHPFPEGDTDKHTPTVEVLEEDPLPEEDAPAEDAPAEPEPTPEPEPTDEYDPNAPDQEWAADAAFDPAAHTVTEVIGFVEDNPDQREAVLELERQGKDRVTLINHLEGMA